jgi:hypothetical protein
MVAQVARRETANASQPERCRRKPGNEAILRGDSSFTHVVNRFTDSQPHLIVSRATAVA